MHTFMTNEKWIYTYDYPSESVWEPWRDEVYKGGAGLDDKGVPLWIYDDAEAVTGRAVRSLNQSIPGNTKVLLKSLNNSNHFLTYLLLSDSHFTYNGTWDDTVFSMKAVTSALADKGIRIDGVIHLGDLTDGLLHMDKTREIEQCCIRDMQGVLKNCTQSERENEFYGMNSVSGNKSCNIYITPGNHDYNYFRGNTEIKYPTKPQYYIDEPEQKLRLIFIDSFDPKEELRYGFTEYGIHWVDAVLNMMPKDYVAIIFSHVPPIKQLHAWSDWIRNSHILMPVLDKYADRILAYINGHSHCDHLFNDLNNGKFPIISISCAKCEYFLEHKPEGAVVPFRRLGDRTQESFDIMQVDTAKREIYFTRFGAGQDRVVRNHKAYWASS